MENNLISESSLYLRQHAHNPVNWYAWSEEALHKAAEENKPLLISIGYSSCHWCHVMERESFENEMIAAAMNDGFICIKVDREERPDVDHRYMNAVMLLHGQGGWPLNCFALPDGTPFWGGTYFKPDVWLKLLKDISELWLNDQEQVLKLSRDLSEQVRNNRFQQFSGDLLRNENSIALQSAFDHLKKYFDTRNGGMNGSPKFPMPVLWDFLLTSDDKEINDQALFTLRSICKGGIYDQIGGGFARYCVDKEWKVPHFEKMLYDNAQLVSLISNACKKSHDDLLLKSAEDTVAYIYREICSFEGLFYSSVDADSDGEEGRYYLWKTSEWNDALGPYSKLVGEYFGMDEQALWQRGDNILLRPHDDALFAQQHFLSLEELNALISRSRINLLNYRKQRVAPEIDTKVITAWNAMMIAALCDLYEVTADENYLKQAVNSMQSLTKAVFYDRKQLFRIFDGKQATIPAFADDYAFFIKALFRLFQCTAKSEFLTLAEQMTSKAIELFFERETGFFLYNNSSDKQDSKYYELSDGVIPSSNSVLAEMLLKLGVFIEKPDWKEKAENMIAFMAEKVAASPFGHAHWAFLLKMIETVPEVIAITGAESKMWYSEISKLYNPFCIIVFTEKENDLPYFLNRFSNDKTQAFICKGNVCLEPLDSLQKLKEKLV